MDAIRVVSDGDRPTLVWDSAPNPILGPGEILIDIAAAGVNRADLLQARGRYAPPVGVSPILGLEVSGTVAQIYDEAPGFAVGDAVCALLAGGGYAEQVAVPAAQVLPVPEGVSLLDAAALPESTCTVWSNLAMVGRLAPGELVLIHGGGSGIGTMAIQVARLLGARVAATASTAAKRATCLELGAEVAIDYRSEDFADAVREISGGRGADVILDIVGAPYLSRNLAALADGGRIIVIGLLGGAKAELDLGDLMAKRASVIGTQLRTRRETGAGSKAEVVAGVRAHLWPEIGAGRLRPVIGAQVPLAEAGRAHEMLRLGAVTGKVVLVR